MSKEAAAGDMIIIDGDMLSASDLAVVIASSRDSARMNLSSWYFLASSWPDSPMRTIFLTWGACRIS